MSDQQVAHKGKYTLIEVANLALLKEALQEAERFMSYFANETGGHFVGPGTPTTCLAQIRTALTSAQGKQE
jgi:hypothetical protein